MGEDHCVTHVRWSRLPLTASKLPWLLIDRRRLILRDRYCSLNLLSQSMLVILNSGLLLVKAICRPSEFTLQTDTFLQSEPANNPLEYVILE